MGPVRGRVVVAQFLQVVATSPAFAEVCDKERPLWNSSRGPASSWDELVSLMTLPFSLGLLALAAIALAVGNRHLSAIASLLWASAVLVVAVDYFGPVLDDVRYYAMKEGCIGPPHLFIAMAIAICLGMAYSALRPRR